MDGFSQAVLEDYGSAIARRRAAHLQTIREGAQRMGQLIDDLLTFSRLSRTPLNKQPVDTGKLVTAALEELSSQGRTRSRNSSRRPARRARATRALLHQVWVNLLSNAIKYTRQREPAVIEIGCKLAENGRQYLFRARQRGGL